MNKYVKSLWLSALRSGKYEQTTQRMRGDEGFCCLGVLADLYGKEYGIEWSSKRFGGTSCLQSMDGEWHSLTETMMRWAGVTHKEVIIVVRSERKEPKVRQRTVDSTERWEQIETTYIP